MQIERKFYTGPFCNDTQHFDEQISFEEHSQKEEFINPAYPFLNQFLKNIENTGICFGISLWKIETRPELSAKLSAEDVHDLITSDSLLRFQLWSANGNKGIIEKKEAPTIGELITIFSKGLHEMQMHGNNRAEVPLQFCISLAKNFLETLEAESGKITSLFIIRYGWADWFALDSHYDFGFMLVTEKALWLMTFSESD